MFTADMSGSIYAFGNISGSAASTGSFGELRVDKNVALGGAPIYNTGTTGANLKRPSKKVGNKRRASFCARMKGMKKKLTSAKTANDPNSRINKALRAWNC